MRQVLLILVIEGWKSLARMPGAVTSLMTRDLGFGQAVRIATA